MINLKALFKRDKYLLTVDKDEAELLQFFLCNKQDFESWFSQNKHLYPKIKFIIFYPSTIDFFYDEFRLFTASFDKELNEAVLFKQLKVSQLNYTNIKTFNWKPFKEVMLNYLAVVEQRNADILLKKQKTLHEYQSLCGYEERRKETAEKHHHREMLEPNSLVPGNSI